jgi:hypothetical protein
MTRRRADIADTYVDVRSIDWSTVGFRSYHPCPVCDKLVPVDGANVFQERSASTPVPGYGPNIYVLETTVYLLYSCCVEWAEVFEDES